MLLPDLCSQGILNTSPRSCMIFTGCESQSGYCSAFAFWCTAVLTAQLHLILLRASVRWLTSKVATMFTPWPSAYLTINLGLPSIPSLLHTCRTVCHHALELQCHSSPSNKNIVRALSTNVPTELIVTSPEIPLRPCKVPLQSIWDSVL